MNATQVDSLVRQAVEDLEDDKIASAEDKSLRALELDREHEGAWTVLGMVLDAQGRHDEAIRVFNSLTLKHPDKAQHWENLGSVYRSAKRYDASLEAFQRALALGTPSPVMLYNLALVHTEILDLPSAHEVLSRAHQGAPRDAWICTALAKTCFDLGDFEGAVKALDGWQQYEGLTAACLAEVAYLLTLMGQTIKAQPAIDRLASLSPLGRAALTQANVLERLNRLAESRSALQRARFGSSRPGSDPDLLLAEAILAQRESNHTQARDFLNEALRDHANFPLRHNLLFPLAVSLDALGDYADAFAVMREAHESQAAYLEAAIGKTAAVESPTVQLTARGVASGEVDGWLDESAPSSSASPVFVVGFPRSGTTLLELALDGHPALRSMDEQPFLARVIDHVRSMGLEYPRDLGKLTAAQLALLRAQYWRRVEGQVRLEPGQRLIDKNPLNMLRLPLIRRLFPKAHTVLIVRHPCDVLMSCYIQHFRAPDLALICKDLTTLATSYRRFFDYWYEQLPRLGASTFEVRYETLIADFESQLRALMSYLRVPWDPALLSPASQAHARGFVSTPSYTQVIQPVTSRAIGRWKHYASQLGEVMSVLEPYIARFG
jgi:tetratricopeptide (TPR) repeat protein